MIEYNTISNNINFENILHSNDQRKLRIYRSRLAESTQIDLTQGEFVLYNLSGSFTVNIGEYSYKIKDRKSVTENNPAAIQFINSQESLRINIIINSKYADFLLVHLDSPQSKDHSSIVNFESHKVGKKHYSRYVREGNSDYSIFKIHCGETLNDTGCWSSWPSHANDNDLISFSNEETYWNEAFFVITPAYGVMHYKGMFEPGKFEENTLKINNGDCFYTPLGSHPIVASPDSWLWYAWFYYGDALTKQYNRWATDVKTYVK